MEPGRPPIRINEIAAFGIDITRLEKHRRISAIPKPNVWLDPCEDWSIRVRVHGVLMRIEIESHFQNPVASALIVVAATATPPSSTLGAAAAFVLSPW